MLFFVTDGCVLSETGGHVSMRQNGGTLRGTVILFFVTGTKGCVLNWTDGCV